MAIEFTVEYLRNVLLPLVLERFNELVSAPLNHPDMIWIVAPMVLIVLSMNFYFGRHHNEELGWNTAFGNSLVLVFVSVDLVRFMYHMAEPVGWRNFLANPVESLVVVGVGVEGLLLYFTNYLHALPKKLSFWVGSALPVNLQAYIAIAIVYTEIPFDGVTMTAAVLLFFALFFVLKTLRGLQRRIGTGLQANMKANQRDEIARAKEVIEEAEAAKKLLAEKETENAEKTPGEQAGKLCPENSGTAEGAEKK